MSTLSTFYALQKVQQEQVVWKLLRSKNALAIIALLDTHLGGKDRRLPVQELINLIDTDLDELRFKTKLDMPRTAHYYCEQWRGDGFLIRRPVAQTRQETYELSSGAIAAISFAKKLIQPHRAATQSRLNTIIMQINNLALAADKDEANRRALLLEERARVDEQLKKLEAGTYEVLDDMQALEQIHDILGLAREIPNDFVSVRDDFEHINKSLHAKIINDEDGNRDVLEDIFAGVDQISQSASGRSFRGFYSLLRDTDLSETLQDNIDSILDSQWAEALNPGERKFMRELLSNFLDQSQEVNASMTSFARGLRRFVQSQDYQHDRVLKQQLDQALSKAHTVIEACPPNKKLEFSLDLTSVKIAPVSRMVLKNPMESRAEEVTSLETAEAQVLSLSELHELARETEIDFHELVDNVNNCLRLTTEPTKTKDSLKTVSIADVLEQYPATQGVASIVGLLFLSLDQGRVSDGSQCVRWQTKLGQWRSAVIGKYEFFREVKV